MTEIELLEAVLENRKAGKWAGDGLLFLGEPCKDCFSSNIDWPRHECYTRAPLTRVINGFTVPMPLERAPDEGSLYWVESAHSDAFAYSARWVRGDHDVRWLSRGLLHTTKAAAAANCKARLGIDPNMKEGEGE